MKLTFLDLKKLIKYALYSGTFSCVSLVCFSIAVHSLTPKINIFKRFYDSDNLQRWAHYNIFDIEMLFINISMLAVVITISAAGLIAAIIAKHCYGVSSNVLKTIPNQ